MCTVYNYHTIYNYHHVLDLHACMALFLTSEFFCRIEISSESRLKKLRDTEDEAVVTGKIFTQKLKRQ